MQLLSLGLLAELIVSPHRRDGGDVQHRRASRRKWARVRVLCRGRGSTDSKTPRHPKSLRRKVFFFNELGIATQAGSVSGPPGVGGQGPSRGTLIAVDRSGFSGSARLILLTVANSENSSGRIDLESIRMDFHFSGDTSRFPEVEKS